MGNLDGDGDFERMRLPLSLCFHGRVPASLSGLSSNEFGQIAFVFETICGADCELYFMMVGDCVFEANSSECVKVVTVASGPHVTLTATSPIGCQR